MASETETPAPQVGGWVELKRPLVAEGEPVWVEFGMILRGPDPIEVDTYDSGECFLAGFIDLHLEPAASAKAGLPRCEPLRVILQPGELWKTTPVDLAKHFELSSQHQVSFRFRGAKGFAWSGWQSNGTDSFRMVKPVLDGEIDKTHPLVLPTGVLTFLGHGHKRMPANSNRSPLMISMTWTPLGGKKKAVSASINTRGSRQFKAGPHTLEVLDHRYDEWMKLRVFP